MYRINERKKGGEGSGVREYIEIQISVSDRERTRYFFLPRGE